MKKIISLILVISFLVSVFSITSFADEKDLDISIITWDDIMSMNSVEYRRLLAEFERVYDPFGYYKTSPLLEENRKKINGGVQTYWVSGDESDDILTGSHEIITAKACGILMNDKGFWGGNENGSIIIALMLSYASIIPDKDPVLGVMQAFAGHFYDPDTDVKKLNTARTNAEKYFNKAVESYDANDVNSEEFIKAVGKMMHYVEDACAPHHAANYYAGFTKHKEFEKYVDQHIDSYFNGLDSLESQKYSTALSSSIGIMVHDFAKISKGYAPQVKNTLPIPQTDVIGSITARNAVIITVMALYKLSVEADIPLNK